MFQALPSLFTFIFFSFRFSVFCLCFPFFVSCFIIFPFLGCDSRQATDRTKHSVCVYPPPLQGILPFSEGKLFRSNTQENTIYVHVYDYIYIYIYIYVVSLPICSMCIFIILIDTASLATLTQSQPFPSAFFLSKKVPEGKSPLCLFRTRLSFVPSFHDLTLASMGVVALQNFSPSPL